MKPIKVLGLFCLAILTFLLTLASCQSPEYANPIATNTASHVSFDESCLTPEAEQRPVWECYEIPTTGPAYQSVSIRHQDGTEHQVLTFQSDGQTKFRFTPTQKGTWTFSTGGTIDINADRPDYAKGFVAVQGQKWIRTATQEAFVPQFVMYDKKDLDAALKEFVEEHGFTGFHVTQLRDFMSNPDYFEAVVLKTYRMGGTTHFWIWGDREREETPDTYGIDSDRLYQEIAARLAPIPGWTVGYGFDLFEWASAEELEQFRETLHRYSSYHHLIGGRGHKNEYREISPNLDYASWEWHRPSYEDYRDHLEKAGDRPAFSEDRFRIRTPSRYPEKDYDPELTLRGLWHSLMAGGVANIWGYQPEGEEFSAPYPNKDAIKTYSQFTNQMFTIGMEPDNDLIDAGYCLRDGQRQAICYAEDVSDVVLKPAKLESVERIFAIDTRLPYEEIEISGSGEAIEWTAPYESDWAFALIAS